ncbi:hypothetical protein KSP39_PZI006671 [Platanthera zijinensis]|uniref:Uncharacterized protein n=1 Tax=Platanthera zijinensis TaxID=2320716 RepID=A0AAP0BQJ8_9ASPA
MWKLRKMCGRARKVNSGLLKHCALLLIIQVLPKGLSASHQESQLRSGHIGAEAIDFSFDLHTIELAMLFFRLSLCVNIKCIYFSLTQPVVFFGSPLLLYVDHKSPPFAHEYKYFVISNTMLPRI